MLTVQRLFVVVFVAAVVALSLNAKGESDMATLNDLVGQIDNAALRERIEEEIKRVVKQKKFGLVFEIYAGKRAKNLGAVAPRFYLDLAAYAVCIYNFADFEKILLFCHDGVSFT